MTKVAKRKKKKSTNVLKSPKNKINFNKGGLESCGMGGTFVEEISVFNIRTIYGLNLEQD
jgi:hypothetical protein